MAAPLVDPFLALDEFAAEYGNLSEAESSTATRLLTVVSDWIRSQVVDVNEDAAAQVVFEVVRDAIRYGEYERLSEFTNTTSRRTEAGVFNEDFKVIDDYLTPRHKRLLGIGLMAAPVASFPKCDY